MNEKQKVWDELLEVLTASDIMESIRDAAWKHDTKPTEVLEMLAKILTHENMPKWWDL